MVFLLVITTYALLTISDNRPLFAQIRVLAHVRTSTRQLIIDQNVKRGIQMNSSLTSLGFNLSTLNPINDSQGVAQENDNADISSQFGKGVRIALVEPTFTAAAYNNSFYVFYQKYSHVPADMNITNDLNLLSIPTNINPLTHVPE
jgi:hypothetical protein